MIKEIRGFDHPIREYLALNSDEEVQLYELNGEIISIRKCDQFLINLVLDSKGLFQIYFPDFSQNSFSIFDLLSRK